MCGICGIVTNRVENLSVEDILQGMCSSLKHRGPDDQGVFINKSHPIVGLGHRRLSIIDLSQAGRQPISNEDGRIQIVLNGEIYNYQELTPGLEKKGHRFKSHTDTESVIHLYEEYGEECLKYLRGMFVFALWDDRNKSLFLARDRIGKKPLLYYHGSGKFCFASEFVSLLKSGLVEKKINLKAIHYYLSFGYIPAPFTIYENVFKLLPAHYIVLKDNELKIKQYWQLDYSSKIDISEEEASDEVLSLLKDSVKIRMHSDVPLGAFLSGGIDSSAVVALMSSVSGRKVKTFSIGFQEGDFSELKFARNVAEKFGTQHHEFIVKPKTLDILPSLVEHYGEPFADSSCVPTYYVALETKRHVSVALTGDGGDESFAGYERYQAMLLAERFQLMPNPVKGMIDSLANLLPDSINPKNRLRSLRRFFKAAQLPLLERYLRWTGIFNQEQKELLYCEGFKKEMSSVGLGKFIEPYLFNNKVSMLDSLLWADINTILPNDFLVKVDIVTMMNSLEARSPFLDQKLMEFMAKLPSQYKMKRFIKKYILKKAIKGLIPAENIYRRKMGFGMPVGRWFRNELKGFLSDKLLSEASIKRGYFNPSFVRGILREHLSGRADYSFQLWSLLMLELWHIRFID